MRKVLITGGSGLVGSAFDIPNSVKLSRADGDLRDRDVVKSIFEKHLPTHVVHCAARVGGVKANMEYGGDFFTDNIRINTNVIECCRLYKVEKIVNFASTCIFPDKVNYPLTVDKIFNGPPHESNAPYAYAKRMAMVQLEAYRKQYGLKSVTVIPCNIYGPNDNYDLNNSHVVPALIRKCYEAKKSNSKVELWGTGTPRREFIYSKDVAELATRALFSDLEEPLILSGTEEFSILMVLSLVLEEMGMEGWSVWRDFEKPDGQMRKPSDSSRIQGLFPDFKFTRFKDGIRLACEDFKNKEKCYG